MDIEMTVIIVGAMISMVLPFVLPLALMRGCPRKLLFYLAGVATTYAALFLSLIIYATACAFFSTFLAMASNDGKPYYKMAFALATPGLKEGHSWLIFLPKLGIGVPLVIILLRKLKRYASRPLLPGEPIAP